MSITAVSNIACPVCKSEHPSIYRLTGLPVIACPKVTPVGDLFAFPAFGVLVVGAGEGVDMKPEVAAVAPVVVKSVADLEKELAALSEDERRAELEAAIAAKKAAKGEQVS